MKTYKVQDLMVPLSEYATVSEDATLSEAVTALEEAQAGFDHSRYRHRAVLVTDRAGHVIGKISQLDALKALEPKYAEILDSRSYHRLGFTKRFMQSMLRDYHLFDRPLSDICKKAARENVRKFMYSPSEGEYVHGEASLDEAIHQLVVGHHQSLLVTRDDEIVGILRLTDVFAMVSEAIRECAADQD